MNAVMVVTKSEVLAQTTHGFIAFDRSATKTRANAANLPPSEARQCDGRVAKILNEIFSSVNDPGAAPNAATKPIAPGGRECPFPASILSIAGSSSGSAATTASGRLRRSRRLIRLRPLSNRSLIAIQRADLPPGPNFRPLPPAGNVPAPGTFQEHADYSRCRPIIRSWSLFNQRTIGSSLARAGYAPTFRPARSCRYRSCERSRKFHA